MRKSGRAKSVFGSALIVILAAAGTLGAVTAAPDGKKKGGQEEVRKAQPAAANQETSGAASAAKKPEAPKPAAVSTLAPSELAGFAELPPRVQALIRRALDLTRRNLAYTFASHDPAKGGMDCSGAVFHVLQGEGFREAPRQSDEMCRWISGKSVLHRAEKAASLDDEAFAALRPGDLLFWTGTYDHARRAVPVSHVMIYLGKRVRDGKPVIFGASDGRSYEGQRRSGVSVFDFKLPRAGDKAAFRGYGSVPGIGTK